MTTRVAVLACLLLWPSLPSAEQKADAIRLYVFAAPNEFTDEASKEREAALFDLQRHLRNRKDVALVDDRTTADVIVELLRRRREGAERDSDLRPKGVPPRLVHVKVSAGTYETELVGSSKTTIKRFAAKNAGDKVLKWVKDNRQKLIAARQP